MSVRKVGATHQKSISVRMNMGAKIVLTILLLPIVFSAKDLIVRIVAITLIGVIWKNRPTTQQG